MPTTYLAIRVFKSWSNFLKASLHQQSKVRNVHLYILGHTHGQASLGFYVLDPETIRLYQMVCVRSDRQVLKDLWPRFVIKKGKVLFGPKTSFRISSVLHRAHIKFHLMHCYTPSTRTHYLTNRFYKICMHYYQSRVETRRPCVHQLFCNFGKIYVPYFILTL